MSKACQRYLPPPNPLPLGGGTAQWNFPILRVKMINNCIIYYYFLLLPEKNSIKWSQQEGVRVEC